MFIFIQLASPRLQACGLAQQIPSSIVSPQEQSERQDADRSPWGGEELSAMKSLDSSEASKKGKGKVSGSIRLFRLLLVLLTI